MVQNEMKTSIAEDTPFVEWCRCAKDNPEELINFRRHPLYAMVVPTCTNPDNAIPFINAIKSNYPFGFSDKRAFTNMVFGNPYMYEYDGIGFVDPIVIRMLYITYRLHDHFGCLDWFSICEIGPGNGILFKVITDYYPSVRFTFVDIEGPDYFLKKNIEFYGKTGNVDNYYTCGDVLNGGYKERDYDLVISECAFNECYLHVQEVYAEKILKRSKRGKIHFNDEMYLNNKNPHMKSSSLVDVLNAKRIDPYFDATGEYVVYEQ